MTATANAAEPEQGRRGFSLPSAYTILFLLIVVVALLTWIIPAGAYDVDTDGEPIPGTYHTVPANPQRIVVDSLMAPINGLYGIEGEDGSISVWNSGELFGAIDVALFILVIGGFLGVTIYVKGDNPLYRHAASLANLASYTERMRARFFPETLQ